MTNSMMSKTEKPLPRMSSMYFQRNCMTSTNSAIKKDRTYGPIKLLSINLSNFFKKEVLVMVKTRKRVIFCGW